MSHEPAASLDALAADVVVIGDGPAGSALAAGLTRLGVDVILVGPDERWTATYTTWADDIEDLDLLDAAEVWAHRFDRIGATFGHARSIERPYGVIDNEALRSHLRRDVEHVAGVVRHAGDVSARLVVDATGWPPALDAVTKPDGLDPAGWQTAFGVVLPTHPGGPLGEPTMMDFSDPGASIHGRESISTFAYSLPVAGGWLVEETVLTASPAVDPELLLPVLAARLGTTADDLLAAAISTETVRIPMGAPPPEDRDSGLVRFGAAGGMIHPATGYSVGSALRAASRVSRVIAAEVGTGGAIDVERIRRTVWPPEARRTRHLHDYGHDVLLRLDRFAVQRFFDTFFDLPIATWSPYMRIDTPPARLSGVMLKMFATAPWSLRAQLVRGDLRRLLRVLRP